MRKNSALRKATKKLERLKEILKENSPADVYYPKNMAQFSQWTDRERGIKKISRPSLYSATVLPVWQQALKIINDLNCRSSIKESRKTRLERIMAENKQLKSQISDLAGQLHQLMHTNSVLKKENEAITLQFDNFKSRQNSRNKNNLRPIK